MHLVEELQRRGEAIESTGRSLEQEELRTPVRPHGRKRIAERCERRRRESLPVRPLEVPAADLAAAFEKMADGQRPRECGLSSIQDRNDLGGEQGAVRRPARDDDVGAGLDRGRERIRPEIGVRAEERPLDLLGPGDLPGKRQHIIADHGGDTQPRKPQLPRQRHDRPRRGGGVRSTQIADDPAA